jgi:cytochrome bd ubiquinol oxidase subunit II
VLRGSAFAFRTNDIVPRTDTDVGPQKLWERVFALSSVFTPIMVGITIGALASGRAIKGDVTFMEAFVSPWATLFCMAVGVLTLVLFAFLAAVYLMLETADVALKEDFRRRALWAGAVSGAVAAGVFLVSKTGAPEIRDDLAHTPWGVVTMALAVLSACAAIVSVWLRKYRTALICTVGEVTLILWGWALAQYPYLVTPDVTIADSAPPATLKLVLAALLIGACALFPSLYYLYRIFKGGTILRVLE